MNEDRYLTFALTKGRLANQTLELFEEMGISCEEMKDKSTRKLIFVNEDWKLKFFLAKGPDVPTYVEYGAADIGGVGRDEVREGGASILCNISGDRVEEYAVRIEKVFPQREDDCRDYLLKVTDPRLLETTGGIVQGMSGSPILQNGKIVGAVTHVLVDDPTSGYGIYLGRMLHQIDN